MNRIMPVLGNSNSTGHAEADIIWDAMSVASTQDSEQCATPTETSAAGSEPPAKSVSTSTSTNTASPANMHLIGTADSSQTEHYPREGKTFVIRSRGRGPNDRPRVIELMHGELWAVHEDKAGAGILWQCEKQDGWFGFCNVVSGTYMGHTGGRHHDLAKGFCAGAKHHRLDEFFMAERTDGGGYLLLVKQGEALWQMVIGQDGLLETTEGGGTAWDFIEMGSVHVTL